MQTIVDNYNMHCKNQGDINEHLPTLAKYASECESVIELGVRGCVSSWAFCKGLTENGKSEKKIFLNDIEPCNIKKLLQSCPDAGIDATYQWINDLLVDTSSIETDLTFIDTWHVYAQLKRELEKYCKITKKYIIMHDTEVDGIHGETIRIGWNPHIQSKQTGFPVEEIMRGLMPAVTEFLENNKEWVLHEHYQNNNGLTILKRLSTDQ
jgi:hypothetical protein